MSEDKVHQRSVSEESCPENKEDERCSTDDGEPAQEQKPTISPTSTNLEAVQTSPPNALKRRRYEICDNCNKDFDVSKASKNCVFHPEMSEPDDESDFWADHDENCHGTIDSDWCRKEYPEELIYPCCDRDLNSTGCVRGYHQMKEGSSVLPDPTIVKKARS